MFVEKKIQYQVESVTENADETMLIKFSRIIPEGVQWASPSDPFMVLVRKSEHYLSVGEVVDGPIIALLDDGLPAEPVVPEPE